MLTGVQALPHPGFNNFKSTFDCGDIKYSLTLTKATNPANASIIDQIFSLTGVNSPTKSISKSSSLLEFAEAFSKPTVPLMFGPTEHNDHVNEYTYTIVATLNDFPQMDSFMKVSQSFKITVLTHLCKQTTI